MGAAREMPLTLGRHGRNIATRHNGVLAVGILLGAPAIAMASQTIPVDGVYGTKEGCNYYRTLDWNDAYDFFQIEPEALQTAEETCRFSRFDRNTPEEISGPVICLKAPQNDVAQRQFVTHASIFKRGNAYIVQFANGRVWGPLAKC